jgi:hypothetical protein
MRRAEYFASKAVATLVLVVFPAAASLQATSILRLDLLGWGCFLFMWFFQLPIFQRVDGVDPQVRRLPRAGRLRSDVPADGLDRLEGELGLARPHAQRQGPDRFGILRRDGQRHPVGVLRRHCL